MPGRVGPVGIDPVGIGPAGIGFYVHHHGRGHANRARQLIAHLEESVTVFGSSVDYLRDLTSERVGVIELPSDVVPIQPEQKDWPDTLHYAPLNVPGIRERMFLLAEWAYRTQPALLVVDVSVEIALFGRLLSIPTVIVRQNGRRDDPPHRAAYQSARGLLAPYPATLEEADTPDWIRRKTYYAGGFSRYTNRALGRTEARQQLDMHPDQPCVVVMSGLGGTGSPAEAICAAAQACPDWEWWVVGLAGASPAESPANVRLVGRVDDTFPYLRGADVVIASAGNNTVMEVATAETPYVCIPEERPFGEQHYKAKALSRMNAAVVLPQWPTSSQWPTLLAEAQQKDTRALAGITDPRGAEKGAEYIRRMAKGNPLFI